MKRMTQGTVLSFILLSAAQVFAQPPPAQGGEQLVPPPPPPAPPPPPPPPPPIVPPAPPPDPSDWKFAMHGIAGVSVYVQDTPTFVLNGQGPLLPLTQPGGGFTTGADIRQSRFNFSVAGPKVLGGAVPKAVLEIDLFGLNSPGGYGEVSVYSRVRLAYAELNWGSDLLRFGQDHELIFALIPESIGHMAFPATYFNGLIGWREPGLGYFHNIPIGDSKLELALQAIKSDWQNPTDFGNSTANDLNVNLGQLSGWLGGEARVKFTSEHVMGFISGHYNHVEGSHAGDLAIQQGPSVGVSSAGAVVVIPAPGLPNRDWDVLAGVAGVKVSWFGFTLLGSAYVGKNLGPLLGDLLQFPTNTDVHEWGGWLQLGYNITRHLNVWAIGGTSRPTESDVAAAGGGRAQNSVLGAMVRYQEGGFAIGPEYYHVNAKDITAKDQADPSVSPSKDGIINVDQFMLSGAYFF